MRLAGQLPEDGREAVQHAPSGAAKTHAAAVQVKVGSVSTTFDTKPGSKSEPVDFCLNGPGNSPHLALMGRTRSGKTTTGIQMARSIVEQARIPMLLIDPQGTFITDGKLNDKLPPGFGDIQPIEVGLKPIPLDFLPNANVGHVAIQNAAMTLRDSICLCCKSPGDLMRSRLIQSIEQVITTGDSRSLQSIKDTYEQRLEIDGVEIDSIAARLDELTRFQCFAPEMSATDFFSRSWVVSLMHIQSEELKRLVMLLLLDATAMHFLAQPEAPLKDGFRQMRQMVVIDEARKILQERKSESVVQLITRSAAKGVSVMLLSQDPSDFDGHDYDFTTQLGAVVSFCCNQTQRGLRSLTGVYGRKLLAEEFSDSHLAPGIAFAKLPNREAMRIRCWKAG
jgi:DNA sulfur modification protein DndE